METVGFIGVGKIGLPISENLIKSGYRVLGYRRGSLADFEKAGGVAGAVAGRGRRAGRHRLHLPADRCEALDEVVQRAATGLLQSARPGQVIVEFGSHPVPVKEQYVAPLAAKGAVFLDGEVSGTPGMVAARKAVIYLGGPAEAVQQGRAGGRRLCRSRACTSAISAPRPRSSSSTIFWSPCIIAGTAQAMALGLKTGVDKDLLIKAVATGSGGSTQFGIRAPWMARAQFHAAAGLGRRRSRIISTPPRDLADDAGVATDLLDCADRLYAKCVEMGFAEIGRRRHGRRHCSNCRANQSLKITKDGAIRMIGVKKIAHASYETPDLDKQVEYYTDILGLTLIAQGQGRRLSRQHDRAPLGHPAQRLASACMRLGFQLGPDDDLDAFEKQTRGARHQDRRARRTPSRPSPTW